MNQVRHGHIIPAGRARRMDPIFAVMLVAFVVAGVMSAWVLSWPLVAGGLLGLLVFVLLAFVAAQHLPDDL